MENLKRSFSRKFLERVSDLGEIIPINDEKFYLIFEPHNNKAAFIFYKGKDSISISSMHVLDYGFLNLQTIECEEESCNEGAAIWILKLLHQKRNAKAI